MTCVSQTTTRVRRRIASNNLYSLEGSLVAGQIASFATSLLVSRVLGAEARGQLTGLLVWSQAVAFAVVLSIDKAFIALSKNFTDNRRWPLLSSYQRLAVVSLGLASVAGYSVAVLLGLSSAASVAFLVACLGAAAAEYVVGWILVLRNFRLWGAMRALQPSLLLGVCLLFYTPLPSGNTGAVLAMGVAASHLLPVAFTVMASGFFRREPSTSEQRRAVKPLVLLGLRTQVGNALQYLGGRLDLLLMPLLLGSSATGIYSVAASAGQVVVLLGSAGVVRGLVGDEKTPRGRGVAAGILGALVALTIAAGPVLRVVFGPEFESGANPMRLLLFGSIAVFLTQRYNGLLVGRGNATSYAMVHGSNVLLFLLLILLPPGLPGLVTFAFASAASSWAAFAVALLVSRKADSKRRRARDPSRLDYKARVRLRDTE